MDDITVLFQKDPLELTDIDLDLLISKMRQARGQFNLGAMKAGSTKPPTEKQSATATLAKKLNLDLDL